jgi:hypothetical protein
MTSAGWLIRCEVSRRIIKGYGRMFCQRRRALAEGGCEDEASSVDRLEGDHLTTSDELARAG